MDELGTPAPEGPLPTRPPPARGFGMAALFLVLSLAWFVAPVLAFGAVVTAAPFFGEQPTDAEVATSHLYLALAGTCGLLAPTIGFFVALATNRRPVAVLFAILLTVSLGALIVLVLTK